MTQPPIRVARLSDVDAIVALVNGGYRGIRSTRGWTSEAHLLDGVRTDEGEIAALVSGRDSEMLVCEHEAGLIGTVLVQHDGSGSAYLGMLTVDPELQAAGLGRRLIAEAEGFAKATWGATRMWMTVLVQRPELVAYYERRGYRRTGETEPFPGSARSAPLVEGLLFEVLEKPL